MLPFVMEKKDEVARRIIEYLRKNPDAGDTIEGITTWWLQLEKIDESVEKVSTALEELEKKGMLKKQKVKGGSQLYKLCKKS